MTLDDRPNLEERYGRAVDSTHLEVRETRCSIDYLIAAGWAAERLGAKLLRLRLEYDAIRGAQRQAKRNAIDAFAAAAAMDKAARADPDNAASLNRQASQARADAERALQTAAAMIGSHLKSLHDTTQAMYGFALATAARHGFAADAITVTQIAAKAIELWLDDQCPHCEGRGFRGGYLTPAELCGPCDATGRRDKGPKGFRLHRSETGHQFGRVLLSAMDRKANRAAGHMRLHLRDVGASPDPQVAALDAMLAGLRCDEAQVD